MIFVDLTKIDLPIEWTEHANALTEELIAKPAEERSNFIEQGRDRTWGHADLLRAMRALVGNKCWYSEVPLEGADPNIDHFRPKGRVTEVDDALNKTGIKSEGYWWWAFEPLNFRLASMHSNQRRVDIDTDGGKSDFFPVLGDRSPPETEYMVAIENVLALDPCSVSDVSLLWFDSDGNPCSSNWRRNPTAEDERRVATTIWLYHLDKAEVKGKRFQHIQGIQLDLRNADADYKLWKGAQNNMVSKLSFDRRIADIKSKLNDKSDFAGAKRCAVRVAVAKYPWIEEFGLV